MDEQELQRIIDKFNAGEASMEEVGELMRQIQMEAIAYFAEEEARWSNPFAGLESPSGGESAPDLSSDGDGCGCGCGCSDK